MPQTGGSTMSPGWLGLEVSRPAPARSPTRTLRSAFPSTIAPRAVLGENAGLAERRQFVSRYGVMRLPSQRGVDAHRIRPCEQFAELLDALDPRRYVVVGHLRVVREDVLADTVCQVRRLSRDGPKPERSSVFPVSSRPAYSERSQSPPRTCLSALLRFRRTANDVFRDRP